MYQLVFGRPESHVVLAESQNLDEVIAKRVVSGDLLVYVGTPLRSSRKSGQGAIETTTTIKSVCSFDLWLFDWEKSDPNCYARRCQREGWTH